MSDEKNDESGIDYEVIRSQRLMIEIARDFVKEVTPWKTSKDEIDDEQCITLEEFETWRRRLLRILGVSVDE